MLFLIVAEKMIGSCSTKAIDPADVTRPSQKGISVRIAASRDDLPEPTLPLIP